MELRVTESHFVIHNEGRCLWINRSNGDYCDKDYSEEVMGAVCLGTVYGFIGKLQFDVSSEPRLIFIQRQTLVGELRNSEIYCINSVLTVPLRSECQILIESCSSFDVGHPASSVSSGDVGPSGTGGYVGVGDSKLLTRQRCPAATAPQLEIPQKPDRNEKFERRMWEEFCKMFSEADSFYYSLKYDLSNSVQRLVHIVDESADKEPVALWRKVDSRFFWNEHMLSGLLQRNEFSLDAWVIPIIQGFVQIEKCEIDSVFESVGHDIISERRHISLAIVSRRSRHRAGTRYLRRGVDEDGKVANYVETEQIIIFNGHVISFIQTRGSIPVFWSQPGFRYRPPPRLEGGFSENHAAFCKHIEEEKSVYGPLVLVNLVERLGKEKVLGEAFLENILAYDSPDLAYFTFDFHENCRGMKFENVSSLINQLENTLREMNYCWVDKYGIVMKQNGVCRVNCVDCLDRTNVVQTHIAKMMISTQLSKLGLLAPEFGIPEGVKQQLHSIWANNGDTISKQYAGTNALKGDFTRTGERKITGVMKDGMNSANRYYLNRFRDSSRQAVIELMLGIRKSVTEDDLDAKPMDEKENMTEQIKIVITDAKKCVVPENECILGSWGMVNARVNEPDVMDVDTVIILTEKNLFISEYDCNVDAITETQKLPLIDIESMELMFDFLRQPAKYLGLFQSNAPLTVVPNLKVHYVQENVQQFHQLRSSNIRFFNSVAVAIHHPDEMFEALKMISESIKIAVEAQGKFVDVIQQSKVPSKVSNSSLGSSWMSRYFTNSQDTPKISDSTSRSNEFSAASFERFTPKYFRKTQEANIDSAKNVSKESVKSDSLQKTEHFRPVLGDLKIAASIPTPTSFETYSVLLSPFTPACLAARTPVEEFNILSAEKDLVLTSCGVIFVYKRGTASSPWKSCTPDLDLFSVPKESTQIASPVTPLSDLSAQDLTQLVLPSTLKPSLLCQHRHSLPANTLVPGSHSILPIRSVTPEITITEDFSHSHSVSTGSTLKTSQTLSVNAIKRISRSSEDVNTIAMKESHSETAMRENPFPSKVPQKREMFAPLGKLARGVQNLGANYLDPRKLRDNFKQPKNSDSTMKENADESLLVERKKKCKTVIIDV